MAFDALNGALKAAGETTRLRILALLGEAELTVSDLTEILRQSQPRISRHLRLLAEAGLVDRFREGSWAFFRLGERGAGADLARELIARLDPADPILARDRERLIAVRSARAAAAQAYFRRHAVEWDRIRKLHVADEAVEEAICGGARGHRRCARCSISAPAPAACSSCSAPRSSAGSASTSRSTCWRSRAPASTAPGSSTAACARATSTTSRCRRIPSTSSSSTRCCTSSTTARAPSTRRRACCGPAGRLLVVDFAPHDLEFLRDEHAHRRLGFAPDTVTQWMTAAGPRPRAAAKPGAGARLRGPDRGVALARPRSAHRARRAAQAGGGLMSAAPAPPRQPLPCRRGAPHPRLLRVLPAEDRGDGEDACGNRSRGLRR